MFGADTLVEVIAQGSLSVVAVALGYRALARRAQAQAKARPVAAMQREQERLTRYVQRQFDRQKETATTAPA